MKSSTLRNLFVVPALTLTLFIAGCDKSPSGVYTAEGPVPFTLEFNSGKVVFRMPGMPSKESDFTMNGDKINIAKDPDGKAATLTLNSDGSISAPEGIKFVKK